MKIRERIRGFDLKYLYLYFRLTHQDGSWRPYRMAYLALVCWLVVSYSWWWVLAFLVDATWKPDSRTASPGKRTGERSK